jgi:hypothetical protein
MRTNVALWRCIGVLLLRLSFSIISFLKDNHKTDDGH